LVVADSIRLLLVFATLPQIGQGKAMVFTPLHILLVKKTVCEPRAEYDLS